MTHEITKTQLVRMPELGPAAHPAPPAAQAVAYRFPGHARSVSRARAALRDQLALWHVEGDAADSATLLLSELAANAVNAVNAQTTNSRDSRDIREFKVRFELNGRRLRLEVSDTSDERPALKDATDEDVSGRGLALVDALADGWGVEPRGAAGKVVWALLVLMKEGLS
ncbi:ATP-binding protein [Streptomyces sp. TS71-3]|uniref:ATP-binding protein n=1 Tax=Streptomyces sp. TS71-3 TaxID=2733862 RepID=UPI001B105ECA|nr:ATP-binding protein [Streptomyces sp. TS71-3]GHJ36685.1 ATP-binding protein [Streptomyces sp. TS71-3]